jgi:hypothetical protein
VAGALLGGLGWRFLLRRGTRAEKQKATEALARINAEADDVARAAGAAVKAGAVPEKSTLFNAWSNTKELMSEFAGVIDTRIQQISPAISALLRRMEYNTHVLSYGWQSAGRPFFAALNKAKLSEDDFITYKNLLSVNRDKAESFLRKTGHKDLADLQVVHVNATLDKVETYIKNSGNYEDVKFLKGFFPRKVKDARFFANMPEVKSYIARLESKRGGTPLTSFEQEEAISSMMNTLLHGKGEMLEFGKAAGSLQKRLRGRISKDMSRGYHDPHQAFNSYIESIVKQVERQKFYGQVGAAKAVVGPNGENLATANSLMVKAFQGKEIPNAELEEVAELLFSRFGKGETAPSKWVQNFKNFSYSLLIGNPLSAMTQLGDLALSAHSNGLGLTATHLVKELAGRGSKLTGIHKETLMGLENATQEFASTVGSRDLLDWSLKWSGFKAMDTLGKNVYINAAMAKNQRLDRADFISKWRSTFDPEAVGKRTPAPRTEALFKKVQEFKHINNENREDLGFMLWNELSSAQPISLSQMPKAYLDHPDGRMFFMLNSFTIKVLDIMRREVLVPATRAENRNLTEAAKNFANLALWFTTMNGTVEMAKDFVRGKDVEGIEKYIANNALKMMGMNKFMFDSANREGLGKAVLNQLMPPTALGDVALDPEKLVKQTPVIGPVLNLFQ